MHESAGKGKRESLRDEEEGKEDWTEHDEKKEEDDGGLVWKGESQRQCHWLTILIRSCSFFLRKTYSGSQR
eukprot:758494-Hanusia_phi.AAC.2